MPSGKYVLPYFPLTLIRRDAKSQMPSGKYVLPYNNERKHMQIVINSRKCLAASTFYRTAAALLEEQARLSRKCLAASTFYRTFQFMKKYTETKSQMPSGKYVLPYVEQTPITESQISVANA